MRLASCCTILPCMLPIIMYQSFFSRQIELYIQSPFWNLIWFKQSVLKNLTYGPQGVLYIYHFTHIHLQNCFVPILAINSFCFGMGYVLMNVMLVGKKVRISDKTVMWGKVLLLLLSRGRRVLARVRPGRRKRRCVALFPPHCLMS